MDSIYQILQSTLIIAFPLLLVALGGMFSEHSGVINIALEGIMLTGAFAGALFVYLLQNADMNMQLLLILGLLAAGAAGIIYSLLLSFSAVTMKADQTIAGTALNMLIPAVILLFAKMKFNSDGVTTNVSFFIKEVPGLSKIPVIGDIFFKNTYLTVYIAALLMIAATVFYYKTKLGLRLRACGEFPQAAASVGINVNKIRYFGVGLSGLLGGIGGFCYSVNIMDANCNGHTGVAGFGFLALAVMIFGQWKPLRILLSALFFAFLRTLAYSIPTDILSRLPGYTSDLLKMLPYAATIVVLAFTSRKSAAPKAEGIPYDKSAR